MAAQRKMVGDRAEGLRRVWSEAAAYAVWYFDLHAKDPFGTTRRKPHKSNHPALDGADVAKAAASVGNRSQLPVPRACTRIRR